MKVTIVLKLRKVRFKFSSSFLFSCWRELLLRYRSSPCWGAFLCLPGAEIQKQDISPGVLLAHREQPGAGDLDLVVPAGADGRLQGLERYQVETNCKAWRELLDCRWTNLPRDSFVERQGWAVHHPAGSELSASPGCCCQAWLIPWEPCCPLHCTGTLDATLLPDSPLWGQTPKAWAQLHLRSTSFPSVGDVTYGSINVHLWY